LKASTRPGRKKVPTSLLDCMVSNGGWGKRLLKIHRHSRRFVPLLRKPVSSPLIRPLASEAGEEELCYVPIVGTHAEGLNILR
ncbi:MAG: hypothetical protein V3R46_00600, partial [Thermoplasmata archaeon]